MSLCKKCGATHGMGIEDMQTGIIEPINLCKHCLFEFEPLTVQINLTDEYLPPVCDTDLLQKKLATTLMQLLKGGFICTSSQE